MGRLGTREGRTGLARTRLRERSRRFCGFYFGSTIHKVTGGANGTTPSARGTVLGSFPRTNSFRSGKEHVGRPDAGLRVCRVRGSAAVGNELCGRRGEGGRIGQKMIKIEVREVHMERPSA